MNAPLTEAVAALKALDHDGRISRADLPYAEVLADPAENLGSFRGLPAGLRTYLQRFYHHDEAVRTLADSPFAQALAVACAVPSRALYALERWLAALPAARLKSLRRSLRRLARQSTHVPYELRLWLARRAAARQVRGPRVTLGALLNAQSFDVPKLGFTYIEGLPQVRGCESVMKRTHPPVTHAQLIGLDFMKTGGRYLFLEANGNPVLMDARLALYRRGSDPWISSFVNCVRARGFRRLVIYGYRPFSVGHARELASLGERHGISVEVIDDLFSSRVAGRRRALRMERSATAGAFVVRAKTLNVLFDRAILSKRWTRQILSGAPQLEAAGAFLPSLLAPGAPAPRYDAESRYPNIVGKRDGLDRGQGVTFFKLPRVPSDLGERADFFEEYLVPDPCPFRIAQGERIALPDDGPRAWKIRSYALLTPEGVEYLSSIKVISGLAVTQRLPDGEVPRRSVFLSTINEGGVYSAVSEEEDAEYRRLTQAVGDVLLSWLTRKYVASDLGEGALASGAA